MRAATAILLLALALPAPAAALTVADYQKWRLSNETVRATPRGLIEVRVYGIYQGLALAQRRQLAAGHAALFCPPAAPPEAKAVREFLEEELHSPSTVDRKPWPAETPVEDALLAALAKRYPCAAPQAK
jgi:hypothetical protein